VEYPPFTSKNAAHGGLAFELLRHAYPQLKFKPLILPPKRAYTKMKAGEWCLSFYPAPEGVVAEKIVLSKNQVVIGLVRVHQEKPFRWNQLSDLNGASIAMLRTDEASLLSRQFTAAGLNVIYAETIFQALGMVQRGRVDIAMFDNFNFAKLPETDRIKLQFSETYIIKTPVTLFTNPHCTDQLMPPKVLTVF